MYDGLRAEVRSSRRGGTALPGSLGGEKPEIGYYTPEDREGKPIFEEDEQFWNAWVRHEDLIDEFGDDDVEVEQWRDEDVPFISAHSAQYVNDEKFAQADVSLGVDGTSVITVEFQIDDSWGTYVSRKTTDLTPLHVGKRMAAVELAVLAHELESPAETLDYWMTAGLYSNSQSAWAKARQASKQTVSDRVRSARNKLTWV